MVLNPDHPAYSDDWLDNDVERCHHGIPMDEECEACDADPDDELDDELDDDEDDLEEE